MHRYLLSLGVFLFVGLAAGALAAQEEPQLKDLLAAAERTQEHFERRPVRWEIAFELPTGKEILVEVIAKGEDRRTRFFIKDGFDKLQLLEVIATGGYWYVTDEETRYQCWPYEAVFSIPAFYTFMARGEVHLYNEDMGTIGRFEGYEGETAIFRVPLDVEARSTVSAAYEQLLQLMSIAPEPNFEMEEKLETYREFINSGSEVRINTRTGVIEQAGAINQIFRVKSFQKLRVINPNTFKVDDRHWEDRTSSVAGEENDWSDVILIDWNPSWKKGSDKGDLETVMFNRKTGSMRRVAFAYGAIVSRCFSSDHQYCYLTGWMPKEGTIGVFEIDLETNEHFRLGSDPLLSGMNLATEISPDGSLLAVIQIEYEAGPLQFRLHLIDVESGNSIKIGDTHDMGNLNWLPDSSGFVLEIREHGAQFDRKSSHICHMDLDGKITKLCPGSQPALLGKSQRILFEGDDENLFTCDMQGQNRQMVGDGMQEFGFPSPSNPEDRVLMMKFGGPDGPRPYVVDIEQGTEEAIDVGKGLWAVPRW